MISQQNEPSPALQPVQKMNVNIAKDICQNFLSLHLKKTAQNKWHLEASRDHFLCRPLVITFLTEAILCWHNILMSEAGITSHCQQRCQCLLYGWTQETVIPDSTSLPRGPQATLAKAPAEKPVLVTSRNVLATMEVQLQTVILYLYQKHWEKQT